MDRMRRFKIKTYTLTTQPHPGKSSVTHRLELMLGNNPISSSKPHQKEVNPFHYNYLARSSP